MKIQSSIEHCTLANVLTLDFPEKLSKQTKKILFERANLQKEKPLRYAWFAHVMIDGELWYLPLKYHADTYEVVQHMHAKLHALMAAVQGVAALDKLHLPEC